MLIDVQISATDVHEALSEEEAFNFIVELDKMYASWDITEKLYEHFAVLHEEYLKEAEEDEDKS